MSQNAGKSKNGSLTLNLPPDFFAVVYTLPPQTVGIEHIITP